MGDRVSVTLTVPREHKTAAEKLIAQYDGGFNDYQQYDFHVDFEFEEVNYGMLECESHLSAAGIAWMKSWGRGGGFNAGTAWVMFNEDGTIHANDLPDQSPEETLAPFVKLVDQPEALALAMKNLYSSMCPPAWDHQVEYGKLYLACTLINPITEDA